MLKKIIYKIKRIRYRFIQNLNSGIADLKMRALLYYKTEPFYNKKLLKNYVHTNLWAITEIVRLLNIHGFIVDVIDRTANDFLPEDIYDLFIGLGAGNSGKYFAKYASVLNKAVKVLFLAGPDPDVKNELVKERYDQFNKRNRQNAPYMRIITDINFEEFVSLSDYMLCVGNTDSFSYRSYAKYNKPIYPILPSTSPKIRFLPDWIRTRSLNSFLCFAGDGFICKGVDLLVEAFEKMPDMKLYICGPDSEPAFFKQYGAIIETHNNISYEGFVTVGSHKFNDLCSECSFTILNSASEGCATSVVTCLRAGLVPIVNYETGIDAGDYGFMMNNKEDRIGDIVKVCLDVSKIEDDIYQDKVYKTLKSSLDYTQQSFTHSFSKAILDIMTRENL